MLRRIQLAGQWLFLRVEALFNLAFGDRMNPLYYLGPIAYFMLWIVVGTGLYLYVFFETGADEAHHSAPYLPHPRPPPPGGGGGAGGNRPLSRFVIFNKWRRVTNRG